MGPEEALVMAGTARQRKGDYVPGETTPQLTVHPEALSPTLALSASCVECHPVEN